MGSAFTLTLANVFMWKWEQRLIRRQIASNEIYGQYIDNIFLTANESVESIRAILNEANNFHPNIKLTSRMDRSLPFLDVFIENRTGILITSVYHKEAAEPYILPFKSDHPRHVFGNIIETALLRVIRYSSTFGLFNIEQRSIQLMLLYNGYPPRYIFARFKEFFRRYTFSSSSSSPIQPYFKNDNHFETTRSQLLGRQTTAEKQIQSRINRAKSYNETEESNRNKHQEQKAKQNKWNTSLVVHYTHEQRLASNKKEFHQIWNDIFSNTAAESSKLVVGTRNRINATKEMVSKRPRTLQSSEQEQQKTN